MTLKRNRCRVIVDLNVLVFHRTSFSLVLQRHLLIDKIKVRNCRYFVLSLISIQYFITLISSMGEIFYLKMPLIMFNESEMSGIMMGNSCIPALPLVICNLQNCVCFTALP